MTETNKDNIRNVDSGLQKIDLHSEASFSPSTPEIIWFTCITPPNKETVTNTLQELLADSEEIKSAIGRFYNELINNIIHNI